MRTIIIMWISIIVIVGWDFYYFEPEQKNDLIIKTKIIYVIYFCFFTKLRLYKFCKKIIIVQFKFGETIILVNYIGKYIYNVGVPYSFP